jgi:hypothetical protein
MSMTQWLFRKLSVSRYNPDDDPVVTERDNIAHRTDEVMRRIAEDRHPATGLTLADMAANRRQAVKIWENLRY